MLYRKLLVLSITALTIMMATPAVDAQERYRWRDDNGSLRISDRIPPDAAGKRIEVLNARGMVVRVIEPKKTPEELAEAARQKELAEEEVRKREEQVRRDRMLLDSYTSAEEIERRRDNRLAQLETYIRVSTDSVANLEAVLEDLESQAKRHTDAGREVPAELTVRIESTKMEIADNQAFLEAREHEQAQIREQFDADLERFKELRASGRR